MPRKKKPPAICSVEGCDRVVDSRGLCAKHYHQHYHLEHQAERNQKQKTYQIGYRQEQERRRATGHKLQQCKGKCKRLLDESNFSSSQWGHPTGRCRDCRSAYHQHDVARGKRKKYSTKSRHTGHELQRCPDCKKMKPQEAYASSDWGYFGNHCKECKTRHYNEATADPIKWQRYREYNKRSGPKRYQAMKNDPVRATKLVTYANTQRRRKKIEQQMARLHSEHQTERSKLLVQFQVAQHNNRDVPRYERKLSTFDQLWTAQLQKLAKDPMTEKAL